MPRLALIAVTAALLAGACVPPEPSNDIIEDFDPILTEMGSVQQAGELVVGLETGPPPFGAEDPGAPDGFQAAIGRDIADSLGVGVRFVVAPREELGALIDSEAIDVAFPLIPISEKALKKHRYSDPYWVGHQRLLAFTDGIATASDLAGLNVCEVLDEVTGVPLERLGVEVASTERAEQPEACPPGVDAIVAPDIALIGLLGGGGDLTGEQVTTAGYGAMVAADDGSFATFIDSVLGEAEREGRWTSWYEEFISPRTGVAPPEPPEMSLEEATALYPLGS